ncbi:MAG: S1 RNA-binding domain-containing protein, partial [Pseudomonadota bacterium]
ERISLGIKQLEGDPLTSFASGHEKGSIVRGKIKSVEAKGATVQLDSDMEGYLRASEVSRDRVEDMRSHFKEGDEIEAMVINVDRKNRVINLSIKAKDMTEQDAAMKKMAAESAASSGSTNLGALLKAKLDNKSAE